MMDEQRLKQWITHLRAVAGPHMKEAVRLGLGPMEEAFRMAVVERGKREEKVENRAGEKNRRPSPPAPLPEGEGRKALSPPTPLPPPDKGEGSKRDAQRGHKDAVRTPGCGPRKGMDPRLRGDDGVVRGDVEREIGVAAGPHGGPYEDGEIALWRALTDASVDVDSVIDAAGEGSLLVVDAYRTIEVWTDAELSAVHALWWLAMERCRPDWRARVERARDWHMEHTQPDNATNRPWALHVFLLAGSAEGAHYAETLLHNCQTYGGKPDPLSAWILEDAARGVERHLSA